jgi:hypothetical protein
LKLTKSGFFLAAAINYKGKLYLQRINFMLHKKILKLTKSGFSRQLHLITYYKGTNFDQLYDKTEGILTQ